MNQAGVNSSQRQKEELMLLLLHGVRDSNPLLDTVSYPLLKSAIAAGVRPDKHGIN